MTHLMWVLLHVAGVIMTHVLGLAPQYWVTFILVETAGLIFRFPFTWTVRGFLEAKAPGRWGFARDLLVIVWCVWLLITWVLYAPSWVPGLVIGLVMLVFGVWIVKHFFERTE